MKFASLRLIARDVEKPGRVLRKAYWAESRMDDFCVHRNCNTGGHACIGAAGTDALFKAGRAEPAANRSAILQFQVDDVEAEFERLRGDVEVVHEPKSMPVLALAPQRLHYARRLTAERVARKFSGTRQNKGIAAHGSQRRP